MTENVQQKSGNLNDIINIINKANETFAYEIFIPSLKKDLMFREINTSQQQRLLKAIIDSPAYNTEFIFALRSIIKENCIDTSIDVGDFNIFDKMIIAMSMRSVSISNDLDIQFEVPDSEETITRRINLKDLIDTAIAEINISPETIKDDGGIFEVLCDLPTINDEYKLEFELRKNVKSIEIKNERELRSTIGEVFTNEIIKYIKQINIKNADDEVVEINLKGLSYTDRLAILAKLPAKVNNKIIDYIDKVNKEFQKVVLFTQEVEGKTIEQRLKIDASFFTVS